MAKLADKVKILSIPPYVESWCVAKIRGFVPAILSRWQREHLSLPERFSLVLCPQVEINARGGLPEAVVELTDPRLSCHHFTGCSRPYYAVIFTGPDAAQHRDMVTALLPWSESYDVRLTEDAIELWFTGANEATDDGDDAGPPGRRVQDLLASGELLRILA